jgi:hypothetical protein
MKLLINIKNEDLLESILSFLSSFQDDGVEIINQDYNDKEEFSEEYIEKNWKELIMTSIDNSDYYKSDEYYIDRAVDLEERGKI